MKRQRSLKVELVVSSPCRQIRGPTGRRQRHPFCSPRSKRTGEGRASPGRAWTDETTLTPKLMNTNETRFKADPIVLVTYHAKSTLHNGAQADIDKEVAHG